METDKFTFAIITDTHIRPPQGDASSPYAVNDLANNRARYACNLLAAQKPEFTIHLGDMVHTLPHLPTYQAACEEAHRIFNPLKPALHFVPGNHDIGDKPMAASPAGAADNQTTAIYQTQFGDSWHQFEHGECIFIVINSSLVNSETEMEEEQRAWLEATLKRGADKRIFLFSHYPPFINQPDEPPHYDNYAEPGRSWLLELMAQYQVEAVFSGHVHQFFYNKSNQTKLYCMPPTSFTRQDYAELYRTTCEKEFGRNDTGKFAVALVHVNGDSHEIEFIQTQGKETSDTQTTKRAEPRIIHDTVCVHLRHAWHEAVDLPYNGPMEEFSRKRARNDYPLMRLWQMGITQARTPLNDLLDSTTKKRIEDWICAGISFVFVTAENPDTLPWDVINDCDHLICGLEFAARFNEAPKLLAKLKNQTVGDYSVNLTKIHTSADEPASGTTFAHNVSSGFLPSEAGDLMQLLDDDHPLSAAVYQVNLDDDISTTVSQIIDCHADSATSVTPIFNIRFAQRNPALDNVDDETIARRVQEVLNLTTDAKKNGASFQFDTFMDIDRGYSPRNGLLDRSSNFRKAGLKLCNQN